jgi:hypothetical protein
MVFIQNQFQKESIEFYSNDYAYNQMYKNDVKNIDKNILRHSKYIDEKLTQTNVGIKKKNN